jgi:hypothetical protein
MTSKFSPLQPGVLKFAAAALSVRWPEWDREAHPDATMEPWPEREVVAAELLRVLSDAGLAKGVLRSDYADLLNPEKLAAVTTERMQAMVGHPEGESDS